jgi:hypothetical protein
VSPLLKQSSRIQVIYIYIYRERERERERELQPRKMALKFCSIIANGGRADGEEKAGKN